MIANPAEASHLPLITREVRWFFEGSLAATGAGVAAWFARATAGGQGCSETSIRPQDWRSDHYLRLPNADDVGVKLRQGRLEIKGRHSIIGIQRFGNGVEGEVSCWTKWAVDVPEWKDAAGMGPALEELTMLHVAKQRVQRSVRFTQDGIVEVPAGQEVDHGLHMELTRLRVAGAPEDTHWSLGLEASPDGPSCCALFGQAVPLLLAGCPAKLLGAENSMPYPRWLQRLDAGEHSRSA